VFSDFAELSDEKFNALQVVAFYDIWPGNGVGLFSKETMSKVKKGKVFPYSLPSVGPGADPGVQAVSPQVT